MRKLLGALVIVAALFAAPSLALAAPWEPGPGASPPHSINGSIDSPQNDASLALGRTLVVSGWAVDTTAEGWSGIDAVHVYLGHAGSGRILAEGRVGISRPDVAAALDNGFFENSGFEARIPTDPLELGTHVVSVYVRTPDRGWWYRSVTVQIIEPPCPPEEVVAQLDPWDVSLLGVASFNGRVTNNCTVPVGVEINIVILDLNTEQPLSLARTAFIDTVPAGQTVPFSTWADGVAYYYRGHRTASYTWSSHTLAERSRLSCFNVGATRCLSVDAWLAGAVRQLWSVEEGRRLLVTAAEHGVIIERSRLSPGVLGSYNSATRRVMIDTRLDAYSSWERAAVLAHELQHAADHAAGKPSATSADCYLLEEDAFLRQSQIWGEFWRWNLPAPQHSVQKDLNDITFAVARDPVGFVGYLMNAYQHQCD